MAQSIREWLHRPDIAEIRDGSVGDNIEVKFFRDPMRHILRDLDLMYAPADGVVLYARTDVDPDDFLEIKGKEFTLRDMLNDPKYNTPSLVVGIFMTSYDVHINRIPLDAYYLENRETNHIHTHNISMLMEESDLLKDFGYKKIDTSYLFTNERKIGVFYSPAIKGRYYIVQIGDKDVGVIQNWGEHDHMFQGERFGSIRWGSQVDICIPLTGRVEYELLVKEMDHIEAGVDPIIRIRKE